METRDIVERATILRATVGSTVHGLHHGGQDDRDEMAVFVELPEYLVGLARATRSGGLYGLEHFVARTQPEGVRSGPGDLDLVAYSLRKYVRLALKGHPTILLLLFVPPGLVLIDTDLGRELRALRPALLSRRAGRGYLGYLRGQRERLLGTRGQKRVNRPELVEAHGFDTKYAMHAARLGHQGLQLLDTGRITLPLREPARSRVMAIRTGERSFEDALAEIDDLESPLAAALSRRRRCPRSPTGGPWTGSCSTRTAAPGTGNAFKRQTKGGAMKTRAAHRVGRIKSAENWAFTADNRAYDVPMFERESPPAGLPAPAQAA